jgi:hypothetical protein
LMQLESTQRNDLKNHKKYLIICEVKNLLQICSVLHKQKQN